MAQKKKKGKKGGTQPISDERFIKERIRKTEIGDCYVSDDLWECGKGFVVVTRKHTGGRVSFANYLVDTYCLGVKNSFYKLRIEDYEMSDFLDRCKEVGMRKTDYVEAHNIIYGALEFAEDAGIQPDKSFSLTKYFLEEDTDDIPLLTFPFGDGGQYHLFVESRMEASKYIPLLDKKLGKENYLLTVGDDEDWDEDDEDWDEDDEDWDEDDEDWDEDDEDRGEAGLAELAKMMPAPFSDMLKKENKWRKPYSYTPRMIYPETLQLHHPEVGKTLSADIPMSDMQKKVGKLLKLPHDSLKEDLEHILLYDCHLCQEGIYDDSLQVNSPMHHAAAHAIMLLAEVGDEHSLDIVLETMCQRDEYLEYMVSHDSMNGEKIFSATIYKLGRSHLDVLMDFMKVTGVEILVKSHVLCAVNNLAYQGGMRQKVIDWYRELLQSINTDFPNAFYTSPMLNDMIVGGLEDLQAEELLPEIEALCGKDFTTACNQYSIIEKYMRRGGGNPMLLPLELKERYALLRE